MTRVKNSKQYEVERLKEIFGHLDIRIWSEATSGFKHCLLTGRAGANGLQLNSAAGGIGVALRGRDGGGKPAACLQDCFIGSKGNVIIRLADNDYSLPFMDNR